MTPICPITLNNKFRALRDLLKQEATTIGSKKHHHKESVSVETLNKINEKENKKTANNNSQTRTEKVKALAQYTEANKQVKKKHWNRQAERRERATNGREKDAGEENMKI
ncbi:unnamed protein product [Schistosoma curassoni]|uniref:Ribosomal RNA-processing protein 14/surfeit locus protein 6 C-terminal domain-containing protein n=1 Tax=Schistosoma curassoni TaxID=6186 RepID=A0A183KY08_9TREM|nr:unnamed protein product [Schistosoma curassoni]